MLARVKKLTEAMTKTQMFSDIAEKTPANEAAGRGCL